MKRVMIVLAIFLLFPMISSEIIIDQQPDNIYSLGDIITVPTTIKSLTDKSGNYQMDLLCNGNLINFYKNGVSISAGEEKSFEASLILTKDVLGNVKGDCKIKAFLSDESILTQDFTISSLITVETIFETLEFSPGGTMLIKGEAIKENGKSVNGFIGISITQESVNINQTGTINNGAFSVSIKLPVNIEAGPQLVRLNAYEKDTSGLVTNTGYSDRTVSIKQIPTSLEILFDESTVEPGTDVRIKMILHDQTGQNIESTGFITLKNNNDKIMEQIEISTDEFFEYTINKNEAPKTWKVVALSNKITSEASFEIAEKESVNIEIIEGEVIITNTGNVPYNKTIVVKIGNESVGIDVYLDVDKSQKYRLTAPDGEYNIEIITSGETTKAEGLSLTGKAIDVKKAGANIGNIAKYPLVWIFVLIVLGFFTFIVFKKGYQKSFVGYISKRKEKDISNKSLPLVNNSLIKSKNRAELSLSIKGDKQTTSVVAVHIKNLKEISKKDNSTEETLQKIVYVAEGHKAATYENQETILFIFAPSITKTFKNERTALETAIKIRSLLEHHNKMFKQKIDFGISINHGEMIAKVDQKESMLKFMAMGTLISASKKISSLAHHEILLSDKMNDRLRNDVKTEKHHKSGTNVFSIKEIKRKEDHSKFLSNFLHKLERDKRK